MKNKKSENSDYKIGQIIEYRRKIGKFIGKNNGEFIVFFLDHIRILTKKQFNRANIYNNIIPTITYGAYELLVFKNSNKK